MNTSSIVWARWVVFVPVVFALHGCFFIMFPIPNLSKPAELQKTIDALEKSDETKALAYTSEAGVFGARMYVWGKYASTTLSQSEVDRMALAACENSLANYKGMTEGGQPKYNFTGSKCEMYQFSIKPNSVSSSQTTRVQPPPVAPQPTAPIKITAPSDGDKPIANPLYSSPEMTTEKKLQTLETLRATQLITEQEYQQKRKEILQGL